MFEERVESFLQVQRSIAQRLEAYNKLYDRQCEQLREDATLVHTLVSCT